MKKIVLAIIIFSLVLASCHHKSVPSNVSGEGKLITETGYASYYGDKFDGGKTASGETFHQNKLTAAHKKLPFGTIVKVTNLSNNKSVTVRINDRGPFVSGRIIDLSKAAAQQIDLVAAGVTKVKIEYRKKS
ncbi:MAG: septal ring lytic transglycosylase RlpA family lipoprotein [Chitinophaga sp.]|jgi:rare lipoprotein A|nr:septal ring lytic transglycosylase RlpA family lipoprotein [Chitinophaga sp.]